MALIEILLLALLFVVHLQLETKHNVVVDTSCGNVQGTYNGNGYSFKGIPYAVPPVGKLRWQSPVPLRHVDGTCWNGTFSATKFGKTCMQKDLLNGDNLERIIGSEDCLYLNVWTPTLNPNASLPVMIWIHGGSLQICNANWPTYCPSEELANETNVVYVSMNYRLHAFGFMALDILSARSPRNTSGNYGFMDQILAMEWTRDNIRGFGGDPSQVTLFGQSSGGTSIFALLASPLAKGLFHKAWMLSASPVLNKTTAEASQDNLMFLKNLNCSDVSCLISRTGEEIVRAVPWDVYPAWAMSEQADVPRKNVIYGAIAVVDGYVIELPPLEAWIQRKANDVPILIGNTAQETDFMPFYTNLTSWDWAEYKKQVTSHLGSFGEELVERAMQMYPFEISAEFQYTTLGSDLRVVCGNDVLALTAATHCTSPVYRYVVTQGPSSPIPGLHTRFPSSYAFHIWDSFAYLGTIKDYITPKPSDLSFQSVIRREVLHFVHTGTPFTKSWTPFQNATALLGSQVTVNESYHREQCDFWNDNGFFRYSWIN